MGNNALTVAIMQVNRVKICLTWSSNSRV